jgi:hypothetical protein
MGDILYTNMILKRGTGINLNPLVNLIPNDGKWHHVSYWQTPIEFNLSVDGITVPLQEAIDKKALPFLFNLDETIPDDPDASFSIGGKWMPPE